VLASALPARLGEPANLRVISADALHLDLAPIVAEPYSVVASLPYHVATPLLFKLVLGSPRPSRLVVMVQEEVAERIAAREGAMTYLGAALATKATARIVRRVPPGAFYPPPKVRSAVLRIDVQAQPTVEVDSLDAFLKFLRLGFTQPRKQLHNSLSQGLQTTAAEVRAAAERAGVDSARRPGELRLEDWAALYRNQLGGAS
jgi:16S rRNA (adenine1518-N6/adenine1519-N6)-dimethyltransferase